MNETGHQRLVREVRERLADYQHDAHPPVWVGQMQELVRVVEAQAQQIRGLEDKLVVRAPVYS